ncbi:MAG: hypothetical protein IJZ72_04105 [Oscillospiraceae bacterium]|nr:hypothetical protein [Oscillospiraceae bacterium]
MKDKSKITTAVTIAVFVLLTIVLILLVPVENRRLEIEKYGQLAIDAETNEKAKYIYENIEIYDESLWRMYNDYYGDEGKVDFVYNYPQYKDAYLTMTFTQEELNSEKPVKLYMSDTRWAYEKMAGNYIYEVGCAPVSITMAYLHIKKDGNLDPVKAARLIEENDAIGFWGGLDVTKAAGIFESIGLNVVEYRYDIEGSEPDEQTIKDILDRGNVVFLGAHGAVFGDHALLIVDYSDEGFEINDPASEEKSHKIWSFEEIKDDIYYIWELN